MKSFAFSATETTPPASSTRNSSPDSPSPTSTPRPATDRTIPSHPASTAAPRLLRATPAIYSRPLETASHTLPILPFHSTRTPHTFHQTKKLCFSPQYLPPPLRSPTSSSLQ